MSNLRNYPQHKDESGFTLVELLVVILIIGILAAIAIPAFLNQRQRANDASVESDVRNVATTIETELIGNPNASSITVQTVDGVTGSPLVASIALASASTRDYVEINIDGVVEEVAVSGDVIVTGEGSGAGYRLYGTHTNGKDYVAGDPLVYDSNQGGFVKDSSANEGNEEDEGNGAGNLTAQEQAFLAEGDAWVQAVRSQYNGNADSIQLSFGEPVVFGDGSNPGSWSLPGLSPVIQSVSWSSDTGVVQVIYRDDDYNRWYITSNGEKWN